MRFALATLGTIATSLALTVATTPAAAQGGGPTACSIIDPGGLERLTGLKDVLGRGPVPTDPSELPKGRTECEYLGLTFSLSTLAAPKEAFDRNRAITGKGGTSVEAVSGVGDDAFYWWDAKPGSYNQVGIAVRAGNQQLTVLDLTSSDSIPTVKPRLLAIARSLVPKLGR